jgi:hypothetical protein
MRDCFSAISDRRSVLGRALSVNAGLFGQAGEALCQFAVPRAVFVSSEFPMRVFISHSSNDKPAVEALALARRERGIEA